MIPQQKRVKEDGVKGVDVEFARQTGHVLPPSQLIEGVLASAKVLCFNLTCI